MKIKRTGQAVLFSFQKENPTKSEWNKRGNRSEFHSEINYYLQNWYFRAKQAKGRAYFGFQSHFSESKISHTSHTLDDLYFWRILYTKTLIFCMLKAIKIYLDEKINGIEFIIGPISPSGSLFGPKLQNCIHATCLYYIHHKLLPQLISIGIARCKLFIKKNVEVWEQILKLKDIGIPALFLLSTFY